MRSAPTSWPRSGWSAAEPTPSTDVIEVTDLSKRFGSRVAVDHLSFNAQPGRVTGFLGPNGSGKSTTMRCMVGLDRPQTGHTRFSGRRFTDIARPLTEIAALLDAGYVHPGRTGRDHLRWLAASNGLGMSRVDDVLAMVGMSEVGSLRVRAYSLGMRQRLGLAGVLLGDPHTVILDEPGNGLDPEGIKWVRDVLVYLADDGRTVLVSSHLLSEMQLMAHDLVVIGQGRLIEQCSVAAFVERHADRWVRVRSPRLTELLGLLGRFDPRTEVFDGDAAHLRGVRPEQVGEAAAAHGIALHELTMQTGSLEDAFLRATAQAVEYQGQTPIGSGVIPTAPPPAEPPSQSGAPGGWAPPAPPPGGSS
jgi:ABC-2 type transport system ATP-binding protein